MEDMQYGRMRRKPQREVPPQSDQKETAALAGPPPSMTETTIAPERPAEPARPTTETPSVTREGPSPAVTRRPLHERAAPRRSEPTFQQRPEDRRPRERERPSRLPKAHGGQERFPTERRPSPPPPPAATSAPLKLQSVALPALTVMAATAFFYYAAPILVPLIAAITFAYVLSPAVQLLKKARIPHTPAVLVVMAVGAALLGGFGYLLFQQSMMLAVDLPQYYDAVKGWLLNALTGYQAFRDAAGGFLPALDGSVLQSTSFADFSKVGGYLFKGLGSALSALGGLALIVLLTLFLLLDQEALRKRLALVLGADSKGSTKILDDINNQIRGFLLVKFLTTVGLAVIFTTGLLLFGVNYAYIWGPLAAVLNLIPYVGSIVGMIPPVIVAAIQTGSISPAIWVLLFFVIVQVLEGNVVTPKLVSDKVNLNLLAVLLSTIYWGWLWGMLGVILAVPITAAVKVVCAHIQPLRPIAVLLSGGTE